MKAVEEAASGVREVAASVPGRPAGRLRAWLADPAVRTALVATLGMRIALGISAVVVMLVVPGEYTAMVTKINVHGAALGITVFPAPLHGPQAYLIGPWLRWDANNYLKIAASGYTFNGSTAFMPLYPLLIRLLSMPLGGNLPASSLLISTAASFAMFVLLYRLVARLTGSGAVARDSVVVACLLPLSFFFFAPYTESLFLGVSLGTILAALDGRWRVAAVLAACACLTRQQGVLLGILAVPAIGAALERPWRERDFSIGRLRALAHEVASPGVLLSAPLAVYGAWIGFIHFGMRQGAPWQVLSSSKLWGQAFFWPGLGVLADVAHLVLQPWQVFTLYPEILLDAVAALVAAFLLGRAWNRLPPGLLLYLLTCWCVAVVKVQTIGITTGAARYLLALLPLCFLPAAWLAKVKPAYRLAFAVLAAGVALRWFAPWVLWGWVN